MIAQIANYGIEMPQHISIRVPWRDHGCGTWSICWQGIFRWNET